MVWRFVLPVWVVGVVLSFALPFVPPWWAWLSVIIGTLALCRRFAVAWLVLAVCVGMAFGVWRTGLVLAGQWPVEAAAKVLTVEVADMPRDDGRRVQFAARAWDERGQAFDLMLSDYQRRDWAVGSRWSVSARVRPVIGEVNVRGLNRETWALANGIDGMGTLGRDRKIVRQGGGLGLANMRDAVSRSWQRTANKYPKFSDGIGLMRALSIGEQSALRPSLWQAFRPLGLTHLVSISGLHVTMVAVLFAWLIKRIFRYLPWIPAKPRVWVLAGGVAGALFYALLAGFSVPTQRSVLMLAAFAWAWWRGSGGSGWTAWWQALAVVLLLDPLAVLAVGTWLSFGLVAALIWASSGRLKESGWRLAVRGQWAATVLSVVLLGYLFASLPLLSPLINVLAILWFSWVLTPLALLGSVFPFELVQLVAAFLAEYTLRGLVWLATVSPEFACAFAGVGDDGGFAVIVA